MGKGTSEIPSAREDGPGSVYPESGVDATDPSNHDELKSLLVKNIMWMLAGFFVIVVGLVGVALIANSGRISSQTGNDLLSTGNLSRKRNACIVDLQNQRDLQNNLIADAVFNRLGILDGRDPMTGKDLPRVKNAEGKLVPDPNIQRGLATRYFFDGLKARDARNVIEQKLKQPALNKLCGKPIVDNDRSND